VVLSLLVNRPGVPKIYLGAKVNDFADIVTALGKVK
jgi:hypothetical protein